MKAKNTILLYQIGETIALYVNSYKQGYHTLIIFCSMYGKTELTLTKPDITISGLPAGNYYLYCQNEIGEQTGDIQINISRETQTESLNNTLLRNDYYISPYTDIVKSLKNDEYIPELYRSYKNATENVNEYETLLFALVNDYNVKQEQLNLFVNPLFKFDKNTNSIISFYGLSYTFYVYRYDLSSDQWILERNITEYDTVSFTLNGKPSELYRILVLSDFQTVRIFYLYQPSETLSETILERRISANRLTQEKTEELMKDNSLVLPDQYKTAAALLEFDPVDPLFQRPIVELDNKQYVTVTIPDYSSEVFIKYPCYLAVLETAELYTGARPHKTKISASTMRIAKTDFLINSDTEYVFYIINETGQKMSQVVLVSFNKEYPVETYSDYYRKIQLDRYVRKLRTVFQQYDPQDWDLISSLIDRYFLGIEKSLSFRDFLIQQLTYLNTSQYRIDLMIQIILLCDLQYYMPIDHSFVQNQVYSKMFKSHVLPASDNQYIIRIARINNNVITYEYKMSYNAGTEIRIDKDNFIWIQCIDPFSWKVSSIAFYNNYVGNGRAAFYFPKLEVTTLDGFF